LFNSFNEAEVEKQCGGVVTKVSERGTGCRQKAKLLWQVFCGRRSKTFSIFDDLGEKRRNGDPFGKG